MAAEANISAMTIYKLEKGGALQQRSLIKVRTALQSAGVIFSDQNGGGLVCGFESQATLTARTCRQARQMLGWSTQRLSGAAGVSDATVRRLEKGGGMYARTLISIRAALDVAGIEFTNGDAPSVHLRKPPE